MYHHAPKNYRCPFCHMANKPETKPNKHLHDVFYEDNKCLAFISPKWWPNNPGGIIIIPKKHYENLYEIPDSLLAHTYQVGKKIAIALKQTYRCDGVSTRQHNEPAGNQDIWHFHLHILPRYTNDKLYQKHEQARFVSEAEKHPYAIKLKRYFEKR